MTELKNEEIFRLIGFLKNIVDENKLAEIESDLRSEDGGEIIVEPEFLKYFPQTVFEIENWRLKIIPYTALRMIQRKISQDAVVQLFEQFLEFCRINDEVITTGAYSISGRMKENKKAVTLRIDIDKISDKSNEAHTVTVFVGYGNTENTISLSLEH